ncbi:type I-G CRISPR-associated protein Cas8g1/Csx17 [Roseospirillum parvum]|uniref:CRISPR-associated protein Csx17 n=1 Tax=Roseospirillum parvum TaxID=83401 RepID=A0A1G8F9V5_9PROT|nr:type I-U CRISPR-associated protein Csx17 [Roseospirillum parvum]SDH78897.1 CRISPR-associated protein Csx17 [Roseospirillum parvum]
MPESAEQGPFTHRLGGCTPTPLVGYLKALGVLRLISTPENNVTGGAADPEARGFWRDEAFHLETRLDRAALERFFLEAYAPSPIVAPWNGRAGFLEGEDGEDSQRTGALLARAFEDSEADRFKGLRRTIQAMRRDPLLQRLNTLRAAHKKARGEEKKQIDKEIKALKADILPGLRAATDDAHVSYVDSTYAIGREAIVAPVLISGGVDGSRDFGVNFAAALSTLFSVDTGLATEQAGQDLSPALFADPGRLEDRGTMGHFGPGQGGPNATTQGWSGENPLNHWDLVLALEGILTLPGAVTRRLGIATQGAASFPFSFEPLLSGSGALSAQDKNRPRAELWLPVWGKPALQSEIEVVFSEGRLTLGQKPAHTGLDAARAVAALGVSRGIAAFERYSLVQPDAKMPYQATPLARFAVPTTPAADLITDLDRGDWLGHLRRLARGDKAPARATAALRRLEDALFLMTTPDRRQSATQAALTALGEVAAWMVSSKEAREKLSPPPRLSWRWVKAAEDRSPEFRIAAALASLGWPHPDHAAKPPPDPKTHPPRPLPMAAHFAPLDLSHADKPWRRWNDNRPDGEPNAEPLVVWGAGGLARNMVAVLERRLIEQARRGLDEKPLSAAAPADKGDIRSFLSDPGFDDARCAALLGGLVWAHPAGLDGRRVDPPPVVPFAYAALKPLFTPDGTLHERKILAEGARLPVPPGLLARLRAGQTDPAVHAALTRARASGLVSPFDPTRLGRAASCFGAGLSGERLAAALLIPLDPKDFPYLISAAYADPRNPDEDEDEDDNLDPTDPDPDQETDHAA